MTNATISESRGADTMTKMVAVELEVSVEIDAPATTVWQTLLEDANQWWPHAHRYMKERGRMEIDARAGGLFVERGTEEGVEREVLWGRILSVSEGKSLCFAADLPDPEWGPAWGYTTLTLKEEGETTNLTIHDTLFCAANAAKLKEGTIVGWTDVLNGLKDWIEQSKQRTHPLPI